jgi:hypothetical protein
MKGTLREPLANWLETYRDSVGSAADECLNLYGNLMQGSLAKPENQSLMQDLLQVLAGLSPDPQTVSCAMLLVACEYGEDLGALRPGLSTHVNNELDQLLYLIELET